MNFVSGKYDTNFTPEEKRCSRESSSRRAGGYWRNSNANSIMDEGDRLSNMMNGKDQNCSLALGGRCEAGFYPEFLTVGHSVAPTRTGSTTGRSSYV